MRQPILAIFKGSKLRGELNLFFREVHGAEEPSARCRRFGIFRRRSFGRRFRRRPPGIIAALILFARFAAGLVAPGFITARPARGWLRRFAAGRLDAAQRPAQFVNLALVGQLLALGDLDEFEHFVEVVNHLLERRGHFRGVFNGLADGRGLSGAEIGGLDPRPGPLRFRLTLRPAVARRFGSARRLHRRLGFRSGFDLVGFHRFRVVGGKFSRHFGMGFTETTGGFSLIFGVVGRLGHLGGRGVKFNGFRCRGNLSGVRLSRRGGGTGATAAAAAAAPAAPAVGWTAAGGGGQV